MSQPPVRVKYAIFDYPSNMTFPARIREAIPEAFDASMLFVTAMDAQPSNTRLNGARVQLRLTLEESGRNAGSYPILLDLKSGAARAMARSLMEMADRADKLTPGAGW